MPRGRLAKECSGRQGGKARCGGRFPLTPTLARKSTVAAHSASSTVKLPVAPILGLVARQAMMRKQTRRPRLPGKILFELYLAPHAITITKFAAACGVSLKHMRAIVNGRAAITAAMATRMAAALGTTSPEYWLGLQNAVDLYDAQERSAAFPRQVKRPRPMAIEEARA